MANINILICGNYGAGNLGDELILKGLLKEVRRIPHAEITVMSGNEKETRIFHGVKTAPFVPSSIRSWMKNILNGKAFHALRAIQKSDLVLFGGGGLFNEKEEQSIRIWSSQALMFFLLRKKVMMIGQSFGVIKKPENKKIIHRVCNGMKKICVRDFGSQKILENLKVRRTIHVIKDSALWLDDKDFEVSEKAYSSPYALLSLREWPGIDREEMAQKVQILSREIEEIYQLKVKFLALQKGSTSDRITYERLSSPNISYVEPRTLDELWSEVKGAELVVSMRLHGCILAHIAGKPLLALSYDDKVKNLLTDLGQRDSLSMADASIEEWRHQLQKVMTQPQKNAASIKADIHAFTKILTKLTKTI